MTIPLSGVPQQTDCEAFAGGRSKRNSYENFRTAISASCYYGTDIDSEKNLIACHHSTEEIAEIIGVDSLGYLEVELLEKAHRMQGLLRSLFSGRISYENTDGSQERPF